MNDSGPLELELTSDPVMLPGARETLRRWCLERAWTEEPISEVVLAFDEALTNVIRHSYGGAPDQRILVRVQVVNEPDAGEGVEIAVRDFGRQVALDQICGRDLDEPRPGGLGVHIIRAMMDVAEYSHADGGGIRLVMRKYKVSKNRTEQPDTEQDE